MSKPHRVQRIEEFVKELESGDLKLRVRVLELERAAKKANILQMATVYTVLESTLLNIGVTLSNQGNVAFANGSYVGAGVLFKPFARCMQRVKNLDKFEKMIYVPRSNWKSEQKFITPYSPLYKYRFVSI